MQWIQPIGSSWMVGGPTQPTDLPYSGTQSIYLNGGGDSVLSAKKITHTVNLGIQLIVWWRDPHSQLTPLSGIQPIYMNGGDSGPHPLNLSLPLYYACSECNQLEIGLNICPLHQPKKCQKSSHGSLRVTKKVTVSSY